MSLINDLMQRVASLTNRLNEIGANSKRTEEMPLMNPVDRNSLLRVSKGGSSYRIPVQGIVDELSLPNEVIQIGLLEVVPDGSGESLKIPDTPTPIWRINGQEFLKNTETLVPIPYAANDKYRTDLVVADTNSDFYRVEGTEGDFLGLAPNIPANTVEVTRINIFGNQIGNPSPTPTNGFVTKSSKQYRSVNLNSTSPTKLYLSHESTTFDIQNSVLNGSIGGFYGFSSDNDGYDGLDIYIKNSNANPITIVHNESTASTPFNLPSGIDIVLQENHIAHFKLNKADEVVELVGVSSGGGSVPTLQEVIDKSADGGTYVFASFPSGNEIEDDGDGLLFKGDITIESANGEDYIIAKNSGLKVRAENSAGDNGDFLVNVDGNGKVGWRKLLDDTVTSLTKLWSSKKISDELATKQPKDLVYPTITNMIAAQSNQVEGVVIRVDDASADTRITFPTGADKVAYYQKIAGSTASLIDDYVLNSAPFGNVETGLYTIPQSGTDIGKLDLSNPLGLDATTLINEVESLSIHTGSVVGGNITFRSRTTLRPTITGATEQVYLSEPSDNFDNTATYTIVVWREANKINWLMRKRS